MFSFFITFSILQLILATLFIAYHNLIQAGFSGLVALLSSRPSEFRPDYELVCISLCCAICYQGSHTSCLKTSKIWDSHNREDDNVHLAEDVDSMLPRNVFTSLRVYAASNPEHHVSLFIILGSVVSRIKNAI
jgi:hypothetical protein